MKVSKNMFSVMAVAALLVTLSMPFAAEAKKKHHGKKASHSHAHKAKKDKAAAPAETAPAAPAPEAAPAAPAGH